MIRIANGQGFCEDWLEAPVRLIEQGPIDYLTLDALAEVTMPILEKQKRDDPNLGYACEFPPLAARIARLVRERAVRVLTNAGGVNPPACAREVRRLAPSLKVAAVTGDDILERLDVLIEDGHELRNLETGEPLASIRGRVLSANVCTGAFPLAEALTAGADVVIAGCTAAPSLALAGMIHHFGWTAEQYDLLAAGAVAGHVIGRGAQATGGNSQFDWQSIPGLANIGYPIVEVEPDGCFTVTKHKGTGGRVHMSVVKEQLLYGIGDPRRFATPECTADFTTIRMESAGADRVRICGVRGGPPPADLEVSICYSYGWKAAGTLVYSWPRAIEKAQAADGILRERLRSLGLEIEAVHSELVGVNACHGHLAAPAADPPEVALRIGVRGQDQAAVERFTRELMPLLLSGPPTATAWGEGRPHVREITALWPAALPRKEAPFRVEVME